MSITEMHDGFFRWEVARGWHAGAVSGSMGFLEEAGRSEVAAGVLQYSRVNQAQNDVNVNNDQVFMPLFRYHWLVEI